MMPMESIQIDNLMQFHIIELTFIFRRLNKIHVANIVAIPIHTKNTERVLYL